MLMYNLQYYSEKLMIEVFYYLGLLDIKFNGLNRINYSFKRNYL